MIGAAVVISGVVAFIYGIAASSDKATTAGIVQGYLAPVGIAIAIVPGIAALWKRGQKQQVALTPHRSGFALEVLSNHAKEACSRELYDRWIDRLESMSASDAIPVRWVLDESRSLPARELLAGSRLGGESTIPAGEITELQSVLYENLAGRRQLVILGPAGAGKSATMLLLMRDLLKKRDIDASALVPIYLRLAEWGNSGMTLLEWVERSIETDYPALLNDKEYGSGAISDLLSRRRLCLMLDGLDEMAPSARDSCLDAIDSQTLGFPIVVASREHEYDLARVKGRLTRPAVVRLQPVTQQAACDYLQRGHDVSSVARTFEDFLEHVANHPDCAAAEAVRSPLMLAMIRYVYSDPSRNVMDLTVAAKPSEVWQVLMEAFLMVVYPRDSERRHAVKWLSWIAAHIGESGDVAWWRIPDWVSRSRMITVSVAVYATSSAILFSLGRNSWLAVLLFVLGAGVGGWAGWRIASKPSEPSGLRPRFPRPQEWPFILVTGMFAAGWSLLPLGFLGLVLGGPAGVLGIGLTMGLAIGLTQLWSVPLADSPAATPVTLYTDDRRVSFFFSASGGPVIRLALAQLSLLLGGHGHVDFMTLLREASRRQVLRQSGTFYQFRHNELKTLLLHTMLGPF